MPEGILWEPNPVERDLMSKIQQLQHCSSLPVAVVEEVILWQVPVLLLQMTELLLSELALRLVLLLGPCFARLHTCYEH